MDIEKSPYFCMAPFVLLSTNADGHFRTCSEMQWGEVYNFNDGQSIREYWNCEKLRATRLAILNGEFVEDCKSCYYTNKMGVTTKRETTIGLFFKRYRHLIDEARENNGCLKSMPKWWELRLSNLCNNGCRICSPRYSSFLQNELLPIQDSLPEEAARLCQFAQHRFSEFGFLSDSENFWKALWENIDDIDFLELHGGEPLINKKLWDFLDKVVLSGHARRIELHLHSNLTIVDQRCMDIMRKFKGGKFVASIDAYAEENDYIRFPSKWAIVIENLKMVGTLDNFDVQIGTTLSAFQVLTIDRLLWWLDSFVRDNPSLPLKWFCWPVVKPLYARIEIISLEKRKSTAARVMDFCRDSFLCNEYIYADFFRTSVHELYSCIMSKNTITDEQQENFLTFNTSLDQLRGQALTDFFPHFKTLFSTKKYLHGDNASPDDAFCAKAWIHLMIHPNGNFSSCCSLYEGPTGGKFLDEQGDIYNIKTHEMSSFLNSLGLSSIRRDALHGVKNPQCLHCWKAESHGQKSIRKLYNELWQETFSFADALSLTTQDGKINPEKLQVLDLDLRIGNHCNLKCRTCSPSKSSSWYGDWVVLSGSGTFLDSHGVVDLSQDNKGIWSDAKNDYHWFETDNCYNKMIKLLPGIKKISFSGGEPLISARVDKFLHYCIESGHSSHISLRFETNFMISGIKEKYELWKFFLRTQISVSMDGIEAINDYIRYPSRWDVIVKNIEIVKKLDLQKIRWNPQITISSLNLYYLPEFLSWYLSNCNDEFDLSYHFLALPRLYCITQMPEKIKYEIQKKFHIFQSSLPDKHKDHVSSVLNSAKSYMTSEYMNESFFYAFLETTAKLDTLRCQNIFDALPSFSSLLEEFIQN